MSKRKQIKVVTYQHGHNPVRGARWMPHRFVEKSHACVQVALNLTNSHLPNRKQLSGTGADVQITLKAQTIIFTMLLSSLPKRLQRTLLCIEYFIVLYIRLLSIKRLQATSKGLQLFQKCIYLFDYFKNIKYVSVKRRQSTLYGTVFRKLISFRELIPRLNLFILNFRIIYDIILYHFNSIKSRKF